MATFSARIFGDPVAFAEALERSCVRCTITQQGTYSARLELLELDKLQVRHGQDNLARIAHVELLSKGCILAFIPGLSAGVFFGGVEMRRNTLIEHAPGRAYYQKTLGPTSWANISLPAHVVLEIRAQSEGVDGDPRHTRVAMPPAYAMQRLIRLHATAITLGQNAPELLFSKPAMDGLETTLIEAIGECLTTADYLADTIRLHNHEAIMRRFGEVLEASPTSSLHIAAIANAIGVSTRTLRICCQEHFGMGPKRYLLLHRMQLVHDALLAADPCDTTVTDLATEFSFWELGRFSVAYRALFNESQSATLRRSAGCRAELNHLVDTLCMMKADNAHRALGA